MTTKKHIHTPVESLLSMRPKQLMQMVNHPDGVEGARAELRDMLADGETYLVLDNSCDNRNPDGSCACHEKAE